MRATLGIVGGGQLGRMLVQASQKLSISTIVLDPTPNSPAGKITNQIIGDYKSAKQIKKLAQSVDFITFEIEGANAKVLSNLTQKGYKVDPSPKSLQIIQDKLSQKQFLLANELPTPEFAPVKTSKDIVKVSEYLGYPLVLKARFNGFDGRGNVLVKSEKDIDKALQILKGQKLLVEKFIPFKKELAIQVARSKNGNIKTYPLVETIQQDGICHIVKFPATSNKKILSQAKIIAKKIVRLLNGAGVFAIEMFETKDEKVLVNEIAPRVHNSGHWTIEGSVSSQFENHVRAVCEKPLKSTAPKVKAAVMINILGNRNGKAKLNGRSQITGLPGVSIHIYDKLKVRKQRKMGHITVVGTNLKSVYASAILARNLITI